MTAVNWLPPTTKPAGPNSSTSSSTKPGTNNEPGRSATQSETCARMMRFEMSRMTSTGHRPQDESPNIDLIA
jgi:hypothetical protein